MQYRAFGRAGWPVSEIGYGAWGIGGEQWVGGNDTDSVAALNRAIDAGLNFIDTAAAYGDGHSETLVGRVARARAADRPLYIATKVPPKNYTWPARPGIPYREVFDRDYIIETTEQSLRRLGVERIHLQQLHVWQDEFTEVDDWKEAAERLRRQGKVERFGISINDHEPDSAVRVVESGLVDAVQVIYNIFDQTPETRLFPVCRARQVAIIARCPFDEGALTGKLTPDTPFDPDDFRTYYFRGDHLQKVYERVEKMKAELAGAGMGLPELALRFCLHDPAVSTVIPGMRRPAHVTSNLAVSDGRPLQPEVLAILRRHAWAKNFYLEG